MVQSFSQALHNPFMYCELFGALHMFEVPLDLEFFSLFFELRCRCLINKGSGRIVKFFSIVSSLLRYFDQTRQQARSRLFATDAAKLL